jgi:hypothetical protein
VAGQPSGVSEDGRTGRSVEPDTIALSRLIEENPFKLPGQRSPAEQHTLILDHTDEPLEPIYFNLLDDLQSREGWRVTKLVDTVEGTHGAGFSSDLTRRLQQQQHNAAELMTRMQNQIRQLLEKLQQWRERKDALKTYDAAGDPDGPDQETALWALQNRWRRTAHPDLQSDALKSAAAFERWREHSERELRSQLAVDRHTAQAPVAVPEAPVLLAQTVSPAAPVEADQGQSRSCHRLQHRNF